MRAKATIRTVLAAPGIRHGLRWFINQPAVPKNWRDFAHRKLAKRARFGDRSFEYTTPEGASLRFLHVGTANYLYWQNTYEPETTFLFCELAKRAHVIMDIGAADGIYAILGAAANRDARILAFEPGEHAARTCARNLELNLPVSRRVELHTIALGEEDAESTFYVAGETGGTSSLNPDFRKDRTEQKVLVRKGDCLLDQLEVNRVDLIKIDTESTEPAVLRGLLETLRRHKPDVICEVLRGRTEHELEALMLPLGYRCYWVAGRGLIRQDSIVADATYRHPNYLFTIRPEEELARFGV